MNKDVHMNFNKIMSKVFEHFEKLGVDWFPGLAFGLAVIDNALVLSVGKESSMPTRYTLFTCENNEILLDKLSDGRRYSAAVKKELAFLISAGEFSKFSGRVESKEIPEALVNKAKDKNIKQDLEINQKFIQVVEEIKSEEVTNMLALWHSKKGHKKEKRFIFEGYRTEDKHPIEGVHSWSSMLKEYRPNSGNLLEITYEMCSKLAPLAREDIINKTKYLKTALRGLVLEMEVLQTQT